MRTVHEIIALNPYRVEATVLREADIGWMFDQLRDDFKPNEWGAISMWREVPNLKEVLTCSPNI